MRAASFGVPSRGRWRPSTHGTATPTPRSSRWRPTSRAPPTLLISNLARHTANLAKDTRASILVDATGALADPLQGARVTLYGRAEKATGEGRAAAVPSPASGSRLLCRFPHFVFWRLAVEGAHYIGGFCRIFDSSR